jgi:hypothetical protein
MENFKPDNLNNEAPKEEKIPVFDALVDADLEKQRQAIRQSADQVFDKIKALTDEKNDENKFPLSESLSNVYSPEQTETYKNIIKLIEEKKEFYGFLQKKLNDLDAEIKLRLAGGVLDEGGGQSIRDPHMFDEKRDMTGFSQN